VKISGLKIREIPGGGSKIWYKKIYGINVSKSGRSEEITWKKSLLYKNIKNDEKKLKKAYV